MADQLPDARIDELPAYTDPVAGDLLAIVDKRSGVTKSIDIALLLPASPSSNYKFIPTFPYPLNAVVEFNGKWYVSIQNDNMEHVPSEEGSLWWEEVNKSASGFVLYQPGVFSQDEVYVLKELDGYLQLMQLSASVPRPFNSVDFNAEFAEGKWVVASERAYLGITKNAHGFTVGKWLTIKSGAWNLTDEDDVAIARVVAVPDVNTVIACVKTSIIRGLSGLTPFQTYYQAAAGGVSTTVNASPVYIAISETTAVLYPASGGGSGSAVQTVDVLNDTGNVLFDLNVDNTDPSNPVIEVLMNDPGNDGVDVPSVFGYLAGETGYPAFKTLPTASSSTKGLIRLGTQSEVNEESDAAKAITALSLAKKAVKQGTYSSTIAFDTRDQDTYIDQSSNIVLDASFTNAIHGATRIVYVNGNSTNSCIFTSKFEKINGALDFDNTKLNHIYMTYNQYANKVYYYVVHTSRIVADITPPTIISNNLAANNSYIDITFSEGVFTNSDGTGGLTASDFTLLFTQNAGTATNCVITAVKRNDASTSGAASNLIGGESTVRIFLTITGNSNGNEFISVTPASGTSIYDASGNAMSSAQTTGNVTLNAVDITAPTITGRILAANNAYIDVSFSEGIYTDVLLNPPVVSDFTLTFSQNGGSATAASISSITTTSGGALGGGESVVRFNLAITGTPTGQETIVIGVASSSAICDSSGNFSGSGQATASVNLNNASYSAAAQAAFANLVSDPGVSYKNDMAAFIDGQNTLQTAQQVANGGSGLTNWQLIREFIFAGLDTQSNATSGWKGVYDAILNNGVVWNSGSNWQLNGTNQFIATNFIASSDGVVTQNDYGEFVWVKEWNQAAGATKVLFGCGDGTRNSYLAQSSTNVLNRAVTSSGIVTYNTESVFSNNSLYGIYRTASTTSKLGKNGAEVDSDAHTSNGLPTRQSYIGARNNNGAADLHSNCKVTAWVVFRAVGFDLAHFYNGLSTLIAAVGA